MLIVSVLIAAALLLWLGPVPGRPRPTLRRRRANRRDASEVDAWSLIVESVATAVRAGAAPTPACAAACAAALELCVDGVDEIRELGAAAARGDELAAVWEGVADRSHDPGLHAVAAAWQLSEATGAPLADALGVAARLRRGETERAARAKAALAAPTTSVNLLTALPVCGAALGMLLGADVLSVYTSGFAAVTVLPGAVLILLGRAWCHRMVANASRLRSLA